MIDPLEVAREKAHDCAMEHPDDIDAAVSCLRRRVGRKREDLIVETLVHRAYREMIHQARHAQNVSWRRAGGHYGGMAKVTAGAAVAEVASESLLSSYFIGSRSLGSLTGEEIPGLIDVENAKANGAIFNATLLRKISAHVKGEKTVAECMTEKQVERIFDSLT